MGLGQDRVRWPAPDQRWVSSGGFSFCFGVGGCGNNSIADLLPNEYFGLTFALILLELNRWLGLGIDALF